MEWYNDSKYKQERESLVKLLTATSKGRQAGKEVEKAWMEVEKSIGKDVFTIDDTTAILQVYLDYAYANKSFFSGADEEKTKFLGNEYIRKIVDEIRPAETYEDKTRRSYRDIAWVTMATLVQLAANKDRLDLRDQYWKYLNPSSHTEEKESDTTAPSNYREPEQSEEISPKYKEADYKPEEGKSDFPIVPVALAAGGLLLLLAMKK